MYFQKQLLVYFDRQLQMMIKITRKFLKISDKEISQTIRMNLHFFEWSEEKYISFRKLETIGHLDKHYFMYIFSRNHFNKIKNIIKVENKLKFIRFNFNLQIIYKKDKDVRRVTR